jgi:hypothetical protein
MRKAETKGELREAKPARNAESGKGSACLHFLALLQSFQQPYPLCCIGIVLTHGA